MSGASERTPAGAEPKSREAAGAGGGAASDASNLLAGAVARLRERTRCETAVAWRLREDGTPEVAAAAAGAVRSLAPTAAEFEALARLPAASDLLAPGASATLRGIAERHALCAAAPVASAGERTRVVLLTGGPQGAAARPRALAALAAAARRLALPLAAAEAERRLTRLDAEVRRLDRFTALGRLAQELAHEVRNPLVSVKTFLQLLPERRDDPDFTTRFLGVVTGELERIERLLALVIDYPRASAPGAEAAPVAPTVASVLELVQGYARQRGVALEGGRVAEALPAVALGEDELRQVLLNLLLNAIEATPHGGSVSVAAQARADQVEIVVADAGPGIAPALRERVFQPFFTTRGAQHTGLGLAIARSLVEQAGGRLALRDGAHGGAAFGIELPAAPS